MPWVFGEPNPVTRFTVSIEMRDPIAPGILKQIAEIHGRFRQELPRKIEQQLMALPLPFLPFSGPMVQQANFPHQLGGLVFDYVGPTGTTLRALNLIQNRVIYMTTQYNRWGETWPLAHRILSECGKIIIEANAISGILLEYQSTYQWDDDNAEFNLADFIRADSDLLPPSLIHRTSAVHSYNGWMERPNDDPPAARVDNVNVAIAEGPNLLGEPPTTRWQARIAVQHRLVFDAPIADRQQFFDRDADAVFPACVDRMHELNKNFVRRVLADAMIARVPGLAI